MFVKHSIGLGEVRVGRGDPNQMIYSSGSTIQVRGCESNCKFGTVMHEIGQAYELINLAAQDAHIRM